MNDLISAILVSLKTSLSATVICSVIGIPAGVYIAVKDFRGKYFLVTLLNSLLAVPTVVIGLLIYSLIRRNTLFGDTHLLFSVPAMVLGQTVLALPIIIAFSISAVSAVEKTAAETAITLGARSLMVIRAVVSEARYGIMAAVAAAFGRLIGEIGISMMLGGNISGVTRTMTTAIALETSKGEFNLGIQLGGVLFCLALVINFLLKYLQGKASV